MLPSTASDAAVIQRAINCSKDRLFSPYEFLNMILSLNRTNRSYGIQSLMYLFGEQDVRITGEVAGSLLSAIHHHTLRVEDPLDKIKHIIQSAGLKVIEVDESVIVVNSTDLSIALRSCASVAGQRKLNNIAYMKLMYACYVAEWNVDKLQQEVITLQHRLSETPSAAAADEDSRPPTKKRRMHSPPPS